MTSPRMREQLTERHEALVIQLAGVLLPGGEREPSATDVLRDGEWLRRAIAAHPPLATDLTAACAVAERIDGTPDAVARALFNDHPTEFECIALAVSAAYYMAPEVHASIGWPGQVRRYASALEAADDLDDGILNPMFESPPLHRQV